MDILNDNSSDQAPSVINPVNGGYNHHHHNHQIASAENTQLFNSNTLVNSLHSSNALNPNAPLAPHSVFFANMMSGSNASSAPNGAFVSYEPANNSGGPLVDESELKKLIMNQLEFYFSRENLLHDKYLLAQMDTDQYVPISTIAAFNMIKRLFARSPLFAAPAAAAAPDNIEPKIAFVVDTVRSYAAAQLTQLQLDPTGTKLRAHHKRCVVILREIDKDTPVEAIAALFEACAVKCLHCEHAGNRSWYLSFRDEAEAHVAVQFLKEEVQTFNGEALFARIKPLPLPRVAMGAPVVVVLPPPKNNDINNNLAEESNATAAAGTTNTNANTEAGFDESTSQMLIMQQQQQPVVESLNTIPLLNSASQQGQSQQQQQTQVPPPQPIQLLPQTHAAPAYAYNPAAAAPQGPAGYNPAESYKYFNYYNQSESKL